MSKRAGRLDDARFGLVVMVAWLVLGMSAPLAHAHDIYTSVRGRNGQLCCGGDDCAATLYRERGDGYEFLSREAHWIAIPQDRITFLPVPGDPPSNDAHHAHLCYRAPNPGDRPDGLMSGEGQSIFFYCAFIPPGGV